METTMGGLFGVTAKYDCITDLFFGVDYHSHLGTRRGGLAVMVMEFDAGLPPELIPTLSGLSGVVRCTYLDMKEN